MSGARTLLQIPRQVRRGVPFEVRATIGHAMETGYRPGSDGRIVPRDIIRRFVCRVMARRCSRPSCTPPFRPTPTSRFTCAWTPTPA